MANGWSPKNVVKSGLAPIGASETNAAISNDFAISGQGACQGMVIAISVSGVTVGAGITAKLQSGLNGSFVDSKTVSITAAGIFYIKLLAANSSDQTYLPLLSTGRVVISTGAGSAVTVDSVNVLQPL